MDNFSILQCCKFLETLDVAQGCQSLCTIMFPNSTCIIVAQLSKKGMFAKLNFTLRFPAFGLLPKTCNADRHSYVI